MTGSEIKAAFEGLYDDSFDTDRTVVLMNTAKNRVESELKLKILEALDTSKTASVGDTYLTFKALPTDFADVAGDGHIYVGTTLYRAIPMGQRLLYKDTPGVYYIDHANSQYALCGSVGSAQTISLPYIKATTDWLTDGSNLASVSPLWPSRFHLLIPYVMADIAMSGMDADDINFRMSTRMSKEAERIYNALIHWNATIIAAGMDFSSAPISTPSDDPLANDPNLGNY